MRFESQTPAATPSMQHHRRDPARRARHALQVRPREQPVPKPSPDDERVEAADQMDRARARSRRFDRVEVLGSRERPRAVDLDLRQRVAERREDRLHPRDDSDAPPPQDLLERRRAVRREVARDELRRGPPPPSPRARHRASARPGRSACRSRLRTIGRGSAGRTRPSGRSPSCRAGSSPASGRAGRRSPGRARHAFGAGHRRGPRRSRRSGRPSRAPSTRTSAATRAGASCPCRRARRRSSGRRRRRAGGASQRIAQVRTSRRSRSARGRGVGRGRLAARRASSGGRWRAPPTRSTCACTPTSVVATSTGDAAFDATEELPFDPPRMDLRRVEDGRPRGLRVAFTAVTPGARRRARHGEGAPRAGDSRRVQPLDVRLRSEPGRLALRELLVPADVELERLRLGQLPVEDGPGLAIADGGERRQRRVEALAQRAGLLEQPGVELLARAPGDPVAMDRRREAQPQPGHGRGVAERRRGRRVAAELGDLERARDPARVGKVDPRRQPRGEPGETLDGGREPVRLRGAASILRAHLGIGRQGVRVQASGDGPQVQARAADEDREPTALRDPGQRLARVAHEVGDRERLVRRRRDRARDGARRPAPPPEPSPSRCRAPGIPGASRPR